MYHEDVAVLQVAVLEA
jgi:hypothetical protein